MAGTPPTSSRPRLQTVPSIVKVGGKTTIIGSAVLGSSSDPPDDPARDSRFRDHGGDATRMAHQHLSQSECVSGTYSVPSAPSQPLPGGGDDDGADYDEEESESESEQESDNDFDQDGAEQDAGTQIPAAPPGGGDLAHLANILAALQQFGGATPKFKEADHIHLPQLPKHHQFRRWLTVVRSRVLSASGRPDQAAVWFDRVYTASEDELGRCVVQVSDVSYDFTTLDQKLCTGINDITLSASGEISIELGVKEEQERANHSRVRGLQALADLCAYFKTEAARECIYSMEDLLDVKLQGNNLARFKADWDLMRAGLRKTLSADQEEELCKPHWERQLRSCPIFTVEMALYDDLKFAKQSFKWLYEKVSAKIERHRMGIARQNVKAQGSKAYLDSLSNKVPAAPGAKGQGKNPNQKKDGKDKDKDKSAGLKVKKQDRRPQGCPKGHCWEYFDRGVCASGDACAFPHSRANAPAAPAEKPHGKTGKKGNGKGKPEERPSPGSIDKPCPFGKDCKFVDNGEYWYKHAVAAPASNKKETKAKPNANAPLRRHCS